MERILVAIDFSEISRRAFRVAVDLARTLSAPLHVVHVLSTRVYGAEYAQLVAVMGPGFAEVEAELADFILSETKNQEGLVSIDHKVLDGVEHQEILKEAERFGATLIVVGSHGKTMFEKVLLGSVSSRVLSRSPISVLVVRESGETVPRRILAAVDGTRETPLVLAGARAWARTLGAELVVLHVMPQVPEPSMVRIYPDSDLRPDMRTLAESIQHSVGDAITACFPPQQPPKLQYRVGSPSVEICTEAQEGGFDLVIVGAHQAHHGLDLGNTAARVAQRCPSPVLILRPPPPAKETSVEPF